MRTRFGQLAFVFLILTGSLPLVTVEAISANHGKIADERLLSAALKNDVAQVSRLLEAGVDPDTYDANRNTALIYAARDGRTQIARMLIEAGASPGWSDGEKVTPLILASYKNHIDIVRLLLAQRVSRVHRDKWGRTALDYAKRRSSDDPIYRLLREWDGKGFKQH